MVLKATMTLSFEVEESSIERVVWRAREDYRSHPYQDEDGKDIPADEEIANVSDAILYLVTTEADRIPGVEFVQSCQEPLKRIRSVNSK